MGNLLVPMAFGVLIKSRKHDGKNFGSVVTYQTHDILVVPIIQCSFRNLMHKGSFLLVSLK